MEAKTKPPTARERVLALAWALLEANALEDHAELNRCKRVAAGVYEAEYTDTWSGAGYVVTVRLETGAADLQRQ